MKYCIKCGYSTLENTMFCPDCQCGLVDEENYEYFGTEEEQISGINKIDLCDFIDSNQARYLEIFKKNKNKKIFISINWAAMFFSLYWLFYRKLYKEGFLFLIVLILFMSAVTSAALFKYKGELRDLKEGETLSYSDIDFNYLNNEFTQQQKESQLIRKITIFITFPSLVFGITFGLFADCIYRRYVFKNIKHPNGGVSKISILAAFPLIYIARLINELIQNGLIKAIWGEFMK